MYPARFEYDVPGSLEEALAILAERGDEARSWPAARASSR